jgi:hypothetical protein
VNWRIFIWPLRLPGIYLIAMYVLFARGLLFLFDSVHTDVGLLSAQFVTVVESGLWYLILGSLVNYAQKTLVHVSRGLFGEPIERETELNPFQSLLALKGTGALVIPFATWVAFGHSASALELILPALLFPIIWLNIALDESLFSGFHPERLARLTGGLGLHAPSSVILVSGGAGYLTYAMLWQHGIFSLILSA